MMLHSPMFSLVQHPSYFSLELHTVILFVILIPLLTGTFINYVLLFRKKSEFDYPQSPENP